MHLGRGSIFFGVERWKCNTCASRVEISASQGLKSGIYVGIGWISDRSVVVGVPGVSLKEM